MIRSWKSVVVGLGIPLVAIVVVLPLISNTSVYVFDIPLIFFWMFAWFPLTTLCLWIAWRIDEPHYRDEPRYEDQAVVTRDGEH
jgi:hypothetical protein